MTFLKAFTLFLSVLALSQVTAGALIPPGPEDRQKHTLDTHSIGMPLAPPSQYSSLQQGHNYQSNVPHKAATSKAQGYRRDSSSTRRAVKRKNRGAKPHNAKAPETKTPDVKPPETKPPQANKPDAAPKPKTGHSLPDGSLDFAGSVIGAVPDYVNLFQSQSTPQNQQPQPNQPKRLKREAKRNHRLPSGSLGFTGDVVSSVPDYVNLFRSNPKRDGAIPYFVNGPVRSPPTSVRGSYHRKREAKRKHGIPSGSLGYLGNAISHGPSIINQAEQYIQQQQA
ncbi:MAG: hypothetical protein Q9187_005781 [Circinaria calcarea]